MASRKILASLNLPAVLLTSKGISLVTFFVPAKKVTRRRRKPCSWKQEAKSLDLSFRWDDEQEQRLDPVGLPDHQELEQLPLRRRLARRDELRAIQRRQTPEADAPVRLREPLRE